MTSAVKYTPYDWLNKFYGFIMAAVVGIVSGCDFSIHMCCENSKLVLYIIKLLLHCNSHLKQL